MTAPERMSESQRIIRYRATAVLVAVACGVVAVEVSFVTRSLLGLWIAPFYAGGWVLGPKDSHFLPDPAAERKRLLHGFVNRVTVPITGVYLTSFALIVLGLYFSGVAFLAGILLGLAGMGGFCGYTARFSFSHRRGAAPLPSNGRTSDGP